MEVGKTYVLAPQANNLLKVEEVGSVQVPNQFIWLQTIGYIVGTGITPVGLYSTFVKTGNNYSFAGFQVQNDDISISPMLSNNRVHATTIINAVEEVPDYSQTTYLGRLRDLNPPNNNMLFSFISFGWAEQGELPTFLEFGKFFENG
ncbi:hypothetical protein KOI35_46980 [Actinoplanes bogorensis]|uniref:Uncharacterized protein n=1 Tax=Paractinoplanes bogorensis TaxID=1610840 RepID=A0ABS5Z5T2_9ACTN|nr:hypothetical protein [Actinoplanes bogorensis]MBU2671063.1 hypothetical protein [Actinoplanes bogorensis]